MSALPEWHPRMIAVERDVSKLNRTVFGIQDELTLEWRDGLLQSNQDTARNMRMLREIGLKIGYVVAGMTTLNTLHTYGVSDLLVTGVSTLLSGLSVHH